ncbi:hypothetical protein [Pseudarthrobacter siccitolerans]
MSFQDSIVTGWEGLERTYGLPDPNDEHVLAAAVVGGAGTIVTENLRDFPKAKLPNGIKLVTAKEFTFDTVSMRPELGLRAVQAMSIHSGHNHAQKSPKDIMDTLSRIYGMDAAISLIREFL